MLVDKAGKEVTPGMWVLTFFGSGLVLGFITHFSQFGVIVRTKHGWKRQISKHHTASDLFVVEETTAKDIMRGTEGHKYEELKAYLR